MLSSLLLPLLILPPILLLYILSTFILHLFSRYRSPLRSLPGPPSPSFFLGNLRELHDQENTYILAKWRALYGPTFVYRGFLGGYRLITTDPVAVAHILGRAYDYPKPDFVRDSLASMAAGHHGLLTVEGEDHRRQRKIIAPAFSASHIRSLSPIFWEKAVQLRRVWLNVIQDSQNPSSSSSSTTSSASSPLSATTSSSEKKKNESRHISRTRPSDPLSPLPSPSFASSSPSSTSSSPPSIKTKTNADSGLRNSTFYNLDSVRDKRRNPTWTPDWGQGWGKKVANMIPNPFAAFVPSKNLGSPSSLNTLPKEERTAKVDVLAWFARSTLDVIGEAGFGYKFNSVSAAAGIPQGGRRGGGKGEQQDEEDVDELARAFGVIFSTARQFRALTILQVWFPVLRRFRTNSLVEEEAMATMRRIGMGLIEQKKREGLVALGSSFPIDPIRRQQQKQKVSAREDELDERTKGRDLLSVLIRSNLASDPSQRLSLEEILCQISTFIGAGHETTASALTWTFYALARHPETQTRLRNELRGIPLPESLADYLSSSQAGGGGGRFLEEGGDVVVQAILSNSVLDGVVREALRLYAPASSTMRVAARDDLIPVSSANSVRRRRRGSQGGREQGVEGIQVRKGDIITIPISEMNRCEELWGERGREFWIGRWEVAGEEGEKERVVPGLWGGLMTFLNGNPVNGHRACIGYRFALNEIKIFLFILLRDIEFSIDPDIEIEKKVNVVTRPCVKSEPHAGNQMPLYMRLLPPCDSNNNPTTTNNNNNNNNSVGPRDMNVEESNLRPSNTRSSHIPHNGESERSSRTWTSSHRGSISSGKEERSFID